MVCENYSKPYHELNKVALTSTNNTQLRSELEIKYRTLGVTQYYH